MSSGYRRTGNRFPVNTWHIVAFSLLLTEKMRFSISFSTLFSFFYLSIFNPNRNDFFIKVLDRTTNYVLVFLFFFCLIIRRVMCVGRRSVSVSLFNLVLTVIHLYLLFVFQIMSVMGSLAVKESY